MNMDAGKLTVSEVEFIIPRLFPVQTGAKNVRLEGRRAIW